MSHKKKLARRSRAQRIPRGPADPDHKFVFGVSLPYITSPYTGAGVGGFLTFKFLDVPGLSAVYGLFDQISLDRVDLMFVPACSQTSCTTAGLGGGGFATPVTFHTSPDTTYDTAPATLNQILQYRSAEMSVYGQVHHVRNVVPRAQLISEDNVGSDGIAIAPAHTFFGTANTNNHGIVHSGVAWWINNLNAPALAGQVTAPLYEIFAKYYITGRRQN